MKSRVVAFLFRRVAFTLLATTALLSGFAPRATAQPSGYALDFSPASNNCVSVDLTAPPAGPFTFTDLDARNYPSRFYRVTTP